VFVDVDIHISLANVDCRIVHYDIDVVHRNAFALAVVPTMTMQLLVVKTNPIHSKSYFSIVAGR
jgi:hypothetical protein